MSNTYDLLRSFLSSLKMLRALYSMDIWFIDSDGNYLVGEPRDKEFIDVTNYVTIDQEILTQQEASRLLCGSGSIKFGVTNIRYERTISGTFCIYETEIFSNDQEEGLAIGHMGYSKDITQEVLLSNFPGFAYRSIDDEDFTMTFLSEGCYDLTGYSPEDFYAKRPAFYDLIHPDYRDKLMEEWKDDLGHNEIGSEEYPIETASGETKWVWEQYIERRSSDEVYIATEGFITDITERKLTQEALRDSEERFRTMFEEAPLGIGIYNTRTGSPLRINSTLTEILGLSQEEMLSRSWSTYSHPDDIEPNLKHLEIMEKTGNGFTMDKRYYHKNGSLVWVNMTVAPFYRKEGKDPLHFAMFVDITARKKAEEEILYLSYHDALTGLYNRRYYEMALAKMNVPSNLPLSLIVADVDDLKKINDTFGHGVGDDLLKVSADSIKKNLREHDVVARIGGDEFVVVLPKTNEEEAKLIKERIKSSICTNCIEGVTCSMSLGIATKTKEEESISKKFILAEDRMYKSKRERNSGEA